MNPNLLFPSADARRVIDDGLTATLSDACAQVKGGSVVPTFDRDFFADELATFNFEAPRRLEDVIGWAIWAMESGLVHVIHPRYLGLLNPMPTFPAQCADRIAAVFNPQLATWRVVNQSPLGVVCIEPSHAKDARKIVTCVLLQERPGYRSPPSKGYARPDHLASMTSPT